MAKVCFDSEYEKLWVCQVLLSSCRLGSMYLMPSGQLFSTSLRPELLSTISLPSTSPLPQILTAPLFCYLLQTTRDKKVHAVLFPMMEEGGFQGQYLK